MSKRSASSIDPRRSGAAVAVFAAILAAGLFGLFDPWQNRLDDLLVRVRARLYPPTLSQRIVPIDLSDAAEKALGPSVADRSAFTRMVGVAAEGRLPLALDLLFAGRKDTAADTALAATLREAGGAVIPVVPIDPKLGAFAVPELSEREKAALRRLSWKPRVEGRDGIPAALSFVLPIPELLEAAGAVGHIALRPDRDGLYRRSPLFFRWEGGYIPSLALAAAASAGLVDPERVTIRCGLEAVFERSGRSPLRIPIDAEGQAYIPYPGAWAEGWPRHRLDAVLAAAAEPDGLDGLLSSWDGKILILADLTTARKDFGPTAFEEVYPLSGIHSSFLNAIMTGSFIALPGPLQRLALPLLLAVGVFLLAAQGSRRLFHLGNLGIFCLYSGASVAAFIFGARLPWTAAPLLGLAGAWAFHYARTALADNRERRALMVALERYFPASVSEKILREGRENLPPEKKVLTILFADIAGFTRWSSDKAPELVHGVLSEYLAAMTDILFAEGGTIDKFIGDGIMAFFGDPFPQSDHASRALRAGLAMQAKAVELKTRWEAEGSIPLEIRVGVNTGEVVVGNLGSPGRVEYTAIGAAVNLAQRMESGAPKGAVLAAARTRAAAAEGFRYSEARLVEAKGYDEAVEAYIVLGLIEPTITKEES